MAKQPTSGQNNAADNLQTWILRVYIHCEGCKKKVFKVLQNIDGVYKTVINATEHKATVTGTVSGETLVQKLLKSGKHAEILPESFKADDENQKKKKKQGNNKKGEVIVVDDIEDEKMESEDVAIDDGNDVENDEIKGEPEGNDKSDSKDNEDTKDNSGGGGKKKKKNKKKKKGEKDENKEEPTKNDIDDFPAHDLADDQVTEEVKTKNVEPSMEQLNLGPQMVYAAPPYVNNNYNPYYPTPGYGVSYNTSYPGAESSYYTPPVYGYSQSHPAGYYPPPPPPRSYYPRSAFDDHYDEGDQGKGYCAILPSCDEEVIRLQTLNKRKVGNMISKFVGHM